MLAALPAPGDSALKLAHEPISQLVWYTRSCNGRDTALRTLVGDRDTGQSAVICPLAYYRA